ncbi:hypothetical protein V3C99_013858 [Haemonchus contortus]
MASRRLLKMMLLLLCVGLVNIALLMDRIFFTDNFGPPPKRPRSSSSKETEKRGWLDGILPLPQMFYGVMESDVLEPNILSFFPHLSPKNMSLLRPLLFTKTTGRKRKIAFGILVVKREKPYILQSLHSLLANLEEHWRREVVFIVMFAFINTRTKLLINLMDQVLTTFAADIQSGLIEVVAIPPKWYDFDFGSMQSTFKDSPERLRWGIKQNLDFVYLMSYGSKRAEYYMQLNDGTTSIPRYGRIIFNYLKFKEDKPWFVMHFSPSELTGRLYRSEDVKQLTYTIALYYQFKPVGWILVDDEFSRFCSPEYNRTQCFNARNSHRIMVSPPVFHHIDPLSHSTSQKLKDEKNYIYHKNPVNPPAILRTSMIQVLQHTAQAGYNSHEYMWFTEIGAGDYLNVEFAVPARIIGILIISGVDPAPLGRFGPETVVSVRYHDGNRRNLGNFTVDGDFLAHLDGLEVSSLELLVTAQISHPVSVSYFDVDVIPGKAPTLLGGPSTRATAGKTLRTQTFIARAPSRNVVWRIVKLGG